MLNNNMTTVYYLFRHVVSLINNIISTTNATHLFLLNNKSKMSHTLAILKNNYTTDLNLSRTTAHSLAVFTWFFRLNILQCMYISQKANINRRYATKNRHFQFAFFTNCLSTPARRPRPQGQQVQSINK